MKIVDITARNTREFDAIVKRVKAFVKSNKGICNFGDVTSAKDGNVYSFEVENDGELALELASIVKKSGTAQLISAKDYAGTYDWQSDRYIRPISLITFKF